MLAKHGVRQSIHMGGCECQLTSVDVLVGWDAEDTAVEGSCSLSCRNLFGVGGSESESDSSTSEADRSPILSGAQVSSTNRLIEAGSCYAQLEGSHNIPRVLGVKGIFGAAISNTFLVNFHHNADFSLRSSWSCNGESEVTKGVLRQKSPTFDIISSSLCMTTAFKWLAFRFSFHLWLLFVLHKH